MKLRIFNITIYLFLLNLPYLIYAGVKTDSIYLVNGDRITGEIKKLSSGMLEYKTDDAGTLKVKWDKIDSLWVKQFLFVELNTGELVYGMIEPSGKNGIDAIISGAGRIEVSHLSIVNMVPLKNKFWDQLDGSLDVGFNFTKASSLLQLNFDGKTSYRWKNNFTELTYDIQSTFQDEKDETRRQNGKFLYQYTLPKRWFLQTSLSMEQNTELGLQMRSNLSAAGGNSIISTNHSRLYAAGGALVNREFKIEGEETTNYEGIIQLQYSLFRYDYPKIDFTNYVIIYPSFSVSGRYRIDFESKIKWEIISDLSLSWTLYDNFDSKPSSTSSSLNDWGLRFGIGYTF